MIKTSASAALILGGLSIMAQPKANAQYSHHGGNYGYGHNQPVPYGSTCKRQRNDNRVAGAVVGAIAGGLLGSVIGGEIDDDNDRDFNRRYRGYRGYKGYRGYRGYRRYRGNRDSDGAQIAGTVLGAVIGGVAGSEIAANSTDCKTSDYKHGDIPPPRPRSYSTTSQYGYSNTQTYPGTTTRTVHADPDPLYGGPVQTRSVTYSDPPSSVYQPVCEIADREIRFPDGRIVSEPVRVCQQQDGRWPVVEQGAQY